MHARLVALLVGVGRCDSQQIARHVERQRRNTGRELAQLQRMSYIYATSQCMHTHHAEALLVVAVPRDHLLVAPARGKGAAAIETELACTTWHARTLGGRPRR